VRRDGFYGLDVYHDLFGLPEPAVVSNDPAAAAANRGFPLLSAAEPRWIDPFHYCRLLDYYGVACDPDTLGEPWNPPVDTAAKDPFAPAPPAPAPDPGVPILLARGTFDRATGTATLDGGLSLAEPPDAVLEHLANQDRVPPAEVAAQLFAVNNQGSVTYQTPIADRTTPEVRGNRFTFEVLVPLDPTTRRFEVVRDRVVLATLPVSPTAPTARWLGPAPAADGASVELTATTVLEFEAADADGDALT
jgi:hypothetical protein